MGVSSKAVKQQCPHNSKQTGKRCRQSVVPGRAECYYHGGATPRGVALPQTRHGKYSKDLPTRLASTFHAIETDAQLLDMRDDVRLLDARLVDLVKRVDKGESGFHWRRARDLLKEFKAATNANDVQAALAALAALTDTISGGALDYAAWDELLKTLSQRTRLVEAIGRQKVMQRQVVAIDQLMVLAAQFAEIALRHIDDPQHRAGFVADFGRIIDVGGGDTKALPAESGHRD